METKKIMQCIFGGLVLLVILYYAYDVHAMSSYYHDMDAYRGEEILANKEMYPDYEDFSWGKKMLQMEGSGEGATGCYISRFYQMIAPFECSKEELFEQENEKIIYGEVEKIRHIVCEAGEVTMVPGIKLSKDLEQLREELGEKESRGEKRKYNASLVRIRVRHSMEGELKETRRYWVLVGKAPDDSLKPGDTGIFFIFHNPTRVYIRDGLELVPTVGNITGFGVCKMSYLLDRDKYAEGLSSLKSKEDVLQYWEKHGLLREVTTDTEKEVDIQGKRIFKAVFSGADEIVSTIEEEKEESGAIFTGEIMKINYYADAYGAETEYLVRVENVYRGEEKRGEEVRIRSEGGYMPYRDFNDRMWYGFEHFEEKEILGDDLVELDKYHEGESDIGYSKVGEHAFFFCDGYTFEDDTEKGEVFFRLTENAMSMLRYDKERGGYLKRESSLNPNQVQIYTKKELERKIGEKKD